MPGPVVLWATDLERFVELMTDKPVTIQLFGVQP